MNFIKRALTSIVRKKGKTIILLTLIFVLGNVIAGAISIEQAVKNTEKNIRKQIGGDATIEVDYEQIGKNSNFDYNKIKYVTADTIEQIGKSQYVKYYDYVMSMSLQSKTLKRYANPEDENINADVRKMIMSESPGGQYFNFTGVHYLDILDFKEGKAKLVEGRVFKSTDNTSEKNVIIISKNLAETNNLSIGSVITLENNIYNYEASESMLIREAQEPSKTFKYEFEIIGLFEPEKKVQKSDNGGIDFNYINEEAENRIYTTNASVQAIQNEINQEYIKQNPEMEQSYRNEYYTPVFVLNDPADLKAFKEEAAPLLPEYSIITDSSSSFDAVAAPMKNMEWIASIVLYVAVGATLVILSLLITLFLRDRKHEIGIYLSLGEKKKNVICQIILEVIVVAFIAITLSLVTGNLLARGMSEKMLNNQIISEQEGKGSVYVSSVSYGGILGWLGYGSNISQEELIDSYNVSLGLLTILMFYLVGLGTVLVSTLVPIIYITRLNPKKIMM